MFVRETFANSLTVWPRQLGLLEAARLTEIGGKHVEIKFKLIGSTSPEIFEMRLNEFLASLDKDDIVVDVKFSTSPLNSNVEYNALVHYQTTDAWSD